MSKIILDLCGGTGSWSKPYRDAGYDVRVITLPEYDVREPLFSMGRLFLHHYRRDKPDSYGEVCSLKDVYGILAAPPCTMFSFARTNAKKPRDLKEGIEAVEEGKY